MKSAEREHAGVSCGARCANRVVPLGAARRKARAMIEERSIIWLFSKFESGAKHHGEGLSRNLPWLCEASRARYREIGIAGVSLIQAVVRAIRRRRPCPQL
jgi:hypothetical protein